MSERPKVILYNSKAVFWTMPLGLMAVGSALDPARYEVKIIDARLEVDPVGAMLAELPGAACVEVTVLTGSPIWDALEVSRAVKRARHKIGAIWNFIAGFPVERRLVEWLHPSPKLS